MRSNALMKNSHHLRLVLGHIKFRLLPASAHGPQTKAAIKKRISQHAKHSFRAWSFARSSNAACLKEAAYLLNLLSIAVQVIFR